MLFAQLEAFLAVARLGNMSQAAAALGLTQPTVAARIDALEQEMAQTLFVRSGRGMQLTDAGRLLRPYAERALRHVDDARRAVLDLRWARAGRLALGAVPVVSTYVLPQILKRFMRAHPGVEVAVMTGHPEQVLAMLLADQIQVGLVPALEHPEVVEAVPLLNDELVLVCAPQHPFASRPSVRLADVGRERFVVFDRTSTYFELGQSIGRQRPGQATPRSLIEVDNAEAVKKMVEEGLGIALVPRVAARRELGTGLLREVAIADAPCIRRTVEVIRRTDGGPPGGIVAAFLHECQQTVRRADRPGTVQVAV